jgi:hypothetical protein
MPIATVMLRSLSLVAYIRYAQTLALGKVEGGPIGHKRKGKPNKPQDLGVALCILGEMARLEIDSKVNNIVKPIAAKTKLDVFLSLEVGNAVYNNRETDIASRHRERAPTAPTPTCGNGHLNKHAVERAFAPHFRDGQFDEHRNETVNTKRWPNLYNGRRYVKHLPQNEHISNILGQMRHQKACVRMILKSENLLSGRYGYVLKVRDNTLAVRPVIPENIFTIKVPAVKSCAGWGGLNDKVIAMPRKFLDKTLARTYDYMRRINDRPEVDPFLANMSQYSENTEQIFYWTLRLNKVPYRKVTAYAKVLPFVDGRCQRASELGRKDRWCVVSNCKDCRPERPWKLGITCTAGLDGEVADDVINVHCRI